MLNNNFQNNNLNKLDTLGKIQMQRDQELNMPSQIRSVNNAYDNQNVLLHNPTIQNIPQGLPRNQNIMMQPLQPNYANLLNQNHNQRPVYENFSNYKTNSKSIKGLCKSLLSNMKQNIILLLIFIILSLKTVRIFLRNNTPYLKNFESPIPSTILRGILMIISFNLVKNFL
jgi:hypothetical protein